MRHDTRNSRRTLTIALVATVAGTGACASARPSRAKCEPGAAVRWAAEHRGAATRRPVRVWLDVNEGVTDGWELRGSARLRDAIGYWNQLSLPVTLVMAESPRSADVTVYVIPSFPRDNRLGVNEYRAGLTTLTYDDYGRITRARVFIAETTPYGIRYAPVDQQATLVHELGHALGLPHLANPFALMSSHPRVSMLTAADVALAHSVYRGTSCPRAQLAAGRPYDR